MPLAQEKTFYNGKDPKDIPRYSASEAAQILRMPAATLRSWFHGNTYPSKRGPASSMALLEFADPERARLSFSNIIEAYVLRTLRRGRHLSMPKVRESLDYARDHLACDRILLRTDDLRSMPGRLFIEHYGSLIDLGESGQLGLMSILESYLARIEAESGFARRFFPMTRPDELQSPRQILVDPTVSFGSPVTARRAIRTAAIADRWRAGEPLEEIAEDYGLESSEVQEALRYEQRLAA